MSEKSQHEFDFSKFANLLTTAPWAMLEKVEEEIKNISNVSVEDSMRRFRQTAYLRKLDRLKCFAQTGELPENMTPKEREGYNLLRECLAWTA